MGFMILFGWFYQVLLALGVDIAPMVIALCEKISSIPGIENLLT